MARQCEACGKKVQMGNRVETRGKAKYLGGVGTKITGITRRKFIPNLTACSRHPSKRREQGRCVYAPSAFAVVRFERPSKPNRSMLADPKSSHCVAH